MAIQFIDNQPITFKTDWETDSECKTSYDRACTLYSTDDYIYAQFKQTPCGNGDNLICDTDFVNPNAELVTNGTFNTGATGWTLDLVSYDSINHSAKFSNFGGNLKQTIGSIVSGNRYEISFSLYGATQGSIDVLVGGNSLSSINLFTNGTYTFTFDWTGIGGELKFLALNNFNGWIDNISLKEPVLTNNPCWEVGGEELWQVIDTTSIRKLTGVADYLASPLSNIIIGGYYRFDLTVTAMTQGTVAIKDPLGMTIGTISANGSYSFYWNIPTGQVFTYYADADFDGTLSGFGLVEYGNNFSFQLTDGTNVFDVSDQAEYYQDWVTLKADASGITPGCYQLVVSDACSVLAPEPMNNVPNLTTVGSEWFNLSASNCNATFSGTGLLQLLGPASPSASLGTAQIYNTGLLSWGGLHTFTNNIQIDYEIHTGTVSGGWYMGIFEPSFITPNDLINLPSVHITSGSTIYTGSFIYNVIDNPSMNFAIGFLSDNNILSTDRLDITYIQFTAARWVPNNANPTYSNCVEITSDTDCTKWVGGTCGEDAYGFHFDNTLDPPFQIGARVRSMLINPKYPGDLKRYNDAGGRYTVTRGASDKSYTLFIDYTDEHTHDWLRLATHCDTLNIGYSSDSYKEFVATDGDYEPEWPSAIGDWPSAQARIEVQRKVSTLFNNNAG